MPERISYLDSRMAGVLPEAGEPITDLDKLVWTMGQIAIAAPEVGLPHIRYGMKGYEEVTKGVMVQLGTGYFDDDSKMEKTMPEFAELSFAPIRHHVYGDRDRVGAWKRMLYRGPQHPSTAMGGFMETHVDNDLANALLATNTRPEHKDDYTKKINMILASVGREILPQYVKVHPVLGRLGVPELGLNVVLYTLFKARDEAWLKYEEMLAAQGQATPPKTVAQIKQELHKRADRGVLTYRMADHIVRRTVGVPDEPWRQLEAA